MRRFLLVGLSLAPFLGLSCAPNRLAAPPLQEDAFVRFYADRLIVSNEAAIQGVDTLTVNHRLDSLLHQYSFHPDQISDALEYYKQDGERWAHFHELVSRRLEQLQQYELARRP